MATINRFEELMAWQKARELSKDIYSISSSGTFGKDFDLKSQIRRAGGSVMDNIAEGFGRGGRGEFIQFLAVSKGSANEVKSQLYRALDQQYLSQESFDLFYDKADSVSKMLDGFIVYLNNSEIKGRKYKKAVEDTKL
jgi:four helix bundle protein